MNQRIACANLLAMISRPLLVILLLVNAVVLMGQLWPEGAPPFARIVNIAFLWVTLALFVLMLMRGKRAA